MPADRVLVVLRHAQPTEQAAPAVPTALSGDFHHDLGLSIALSVSFKRRLTWSSSASPKGQGTHSLVVDRHIGDSMKESRCLTRSNGATHAIFVLLSARRGCLYVVT